MIPKLQYGYVWKPKYNFKNQAGSIRINVRILAADPTTAIAAGAAIPSTSLKLNSKGIHSASLSEHHVKGIRQPGEAP